MIAVLLQAMPDDVIESGRNASSRFGKLRRLFLQDRRHRIGGRIPLEGLPAKEQLVEDRSEGEEIRAVVDGKPAPARATCRPPCPSPSRAPYDQRLSAHSSRRRVSAPRFVSPGQSRESSGGHPCSRTG